MFTIRLWMARYGQTLAVSAIIGIVAAFLVFLLFAPSPQRRDMPISEDGATNQALGANPSIDAGAREEQFPVQVYSPTSPALPAGPIVTNTLWATTITEGVQCIKPDLQPSESLHAVAQQIIPLLTDPPTALEIARQAGVTFVFNGTIPPHVTERGDFPSVDTARCQIGTFSLYDWEGALSSAPSSGDLAVIVYRSDSSLSSITPWTALILVRESPSDPSLGN